MNIPAFSVRNGLLVNLLSVFLLVAGAISLMNTRREAFPTFSFDIVRVQTWYPGATPEEIEKLITRPIEDEIKTVSDIDEVQSVSAEGFSLIIIKIDPDARNKSRTVTELQQAVDRVQDLPADLEELPVTTEVRTQDSPIIEIPLSGPFSRKQLQDYAKELEEVLEDLPDVSSIARNGWKEEQVWVELDPALLSQQRVAIEEVVRAVRFRNVNVPGGTIDTGKNEFLVRTNAEVKTPDEIDNIVVRANDVGKIIRIHDVGKAKWAFEDSSTLTRVDGYEAVSLVVIKKQKGDAITMVESVLEAIDKFKKNAPSELQIAIVNDVSFYVKRRLGILLNNATIGLFFVLLSLFLFLSRPVATWTLVGLPVAFGSTLWIMGMIGISVNLISMFGLIIVIGMAVDDGIVVAENIYRYMEKGMPPKEAAVKGAQEVVKPVTVTILTSVVAFLPLAFMTGIFGKFVWTIPVVVIIALVASLVEVLVILPSHLADFSGKKYAREGGHEPNRLTQKLMRIYSAILHKALKARKVFVPLAIVGVFVGIVTGFKLIPLILFPSKGIEIFFVRAEAPVGTSLEETQRQLIQVEKAVAELPKEELKNYVAVTGVIQQDPNDPFSIRGSHVAQIAVYLTPEPERDRTAEAIMDSLRTKIKKIEGFERIWIDHVNPGPPQGKPVAIRVRGPDFEVGQKIADEVKVELKKVKGVRDIRDDYEAGKPEVMVDLKHEAVAMANLTPAMVARTVRAAIAGEIASTIREGEEETDIVVRLAEDKRASVSALESLYVENPRQFLVPMSRLASFHRDSGISAVKHYDNKRAISVTANVDENVTTSREVNQAMKGRFDKIGEKHFGYDIIFGGENKDTEESLDSLKRAFTLAVLFIFLILAGTFRSLAQPFIVMLAIPYGLLSALIALSLHGEPLSFLAFLGLVGLSGVTVNDSIILMDFINNHREEGKDKFEAIIDACGQRLRPVILTSVTTVFGLGPVAYGLGGSDPFLKPMALTITWGIAFGTFLTLILVPCTYALLDDVTSKFKGET